ncbi:MAG: PD-(D/E)XK nuclease family protein, partial [Spirochaetota bacterium]
VLSIIENELENGKNQEQIAVVNIDSEFCEMLYHSMESVGIPSNYSRGLPVHKTPLYSFLSLVYRFFSSGHPSHLFLEIINHGFFGELAGSKIPPSDYHEVKIKILSQRLFHLPSLDVDFIKSEPGRERAFRMLEKLYRAGDFHELYNCLDEIFFILSHKNIYQFNEVKKRVLDTVVELSDLEIEVKNSPFEILVHQMKTIRYPVLGHYTQGVQILGLLELRGLCFDTVIVPTFNEEFFPAKKQDHFFLNTEARKKLGLATFTESEALEFYYLKRLIDSSAGSYLISIADPAGDFDVKSRYWYLLESRTGQSSDRQMAYVLPLQTGRKSVKQRTPAGSASPGRTKPPAAGISAPFLNFKIKSFSRMDVDKILKCQTQYYISRVLNIQPEEELRREIELDILGRKVHRIFNQVYRDAPLGRSLDERKLKQRFNEAFEQNFTQGLFYTSEEVLVKKILKNQLLRALERDIERFRNGQVVCTGYLEKDFTVEIGSHGSVYTLRGRIDRIDRTPAGGYLIIDYKTGRLPRDAPPGPTPELKDVQLGFYGLLFQKSFPEWSLEGLCYFDLRSNSDIHTVVHGPEIDAYLENIETRLLEILGEFNERRSLSMSEDTQICRYCPYGNICRIYE